ncbi:MAG: ribonuclease G [Gammaproteobacteria bacterium]|jgi:ribonuclease G
MSEEILINAMQQEIRVALVEEGVLQELHIERADHRGIVGNIYKGRVSRVLPGMQAAFVDIGLPRAAFLHISDVVPFAEGTLEPPTEITDNISDLVEEQDELWVQITKDPLGTKGARITTHLSLPSRYLVYMPDLGHIDLSQRITDEAERTRLRDLLLAQGVAANEGFIIRTNAEGYQDINFNAEAVYLRKLWQKVQEQMKQAKCGDMVYQDLPLPVRCVRDFSGLRIERVRVDDQETYQQILNFVNEFMHGSIAHIDYYQEKKPIFDLYGIEEEIKNALNPKVALKSGGYLILEQTESMTTIDVNTGGFVGIRNLDETVFKTNLEAAQTIARQLRLRNLGGIIVIDFIDMHNEEHKQQVLATLEKMLAHDSVKTSISQISDLGLVEMTRKRTRDSLERLLCEPCAVCSGRGAIKSAQTVCYDIFRDIRRQLGAYEGRQYMIIASQTVIDRLIDEESDTMEALEAQLGSRIRLQVEALYTQEQYDVVIL